MLLTGDQTLIAASLSGYIQPMYPDRESVERLEPDREQDQARLAARDQGDPDHLSAEEMPDSVPDRERDDEG